MCKNTTLRQRAVIPKQIWKPNCYLTHRIHYLNMIIIKSNLLNSYSAYHFYKKKENKKGIKVGGRLNDSLPGGFTGKPL